MNTESIINKYFSPLSPFDKITESHFENYKKFVELCNTLEDTNESLFLHMLNSKIIKFNTIIEELCSQFEKEEDKVILIHIINIHFQHNDMIRQPFEEFQRNTNITVKELMCANILFSICLTSNLSLAKWFYYRYNRECSLIIDFVIENYRNVALSSKNSDVRPYYWLVYEGTQIFRKLKSELAFRCYNTDELNNVIFQKKTNKSDNLNALFIEACKNYDLATTKYFVNNNKVELQPQVKEIFDNINKESDLKIMNYIINNSYEANSLKWTNLLVALCSGDNFDLAKNYYDKYKQQLDDTLAKNDKFELRYDYHNHIKQAAMICEISRNNPLEDPLFIWIKSIESCLPDDF